MATAEAAPAASASHPPPRSASASHPPARRGVALGLWPGVDAVARLDELVDLGATDVALVVAWHQLDVRASDIQPGAASADDDEIRAALRAAADRGLRALLFPILILDETAAGEWRGTVAPTDVARWWKRYEAFILHHAELAAAEGAPALLIGSELGSTETWRDRWYHLISRVERLYDGELLYSANWDHYDQVSFWDRLDAVGVTGYVELTTDPDATESALTAAWATARDDLLAYAATLDKPLLLTEVGYPSRDGAAVRPWDYTTDAPLDLEEQRRAYAALVATWNATTLAGLYVWSWDGDGGPTDRTYTPRQKPAESILRQWWGKARPSGAAGK